ncbi:PREDICTED: longitudinals lacking protein, isoforms A/B/D/L-like [Trachymyrmex septentrionalis]|uniref:longitudinals lacking protein, isoforms A/B/D/L-like n=1 Tax=Trachymyrmex septentrionalis TaxID=34720 RepID=UPI00084F5E41|nr:PREDICTED: longitudinals lacking protein, isoforms A/B/D/L-like [Trachymyrmex septentrionalis]
MLPTHYFSCLDDSDDALIFHSLIACSSFQSFIFRDRLPTLRERLLILTTLSVLLYGSYGVGLYDSTKPDPSQSIRVSPIRRRGSGRRNHVCPKCGNGYTVIKSLRRHLRYECGLTPRFKCPYCGTRSKQRGHVSQHIRRKHSGQRIYIIDSP